MRIPGFRDSYGSGGQQSDRSHKLHYMGRRTLWADGRRGGLVNETRPRHNDEQRLGPSRIAKHERVDWKKQYKLRHNWARGKCAVEELKLALDDDQAESEEGGKMLVKVIEGLAVTVDRLGGLRAWDLKTRALIAQSSLQIGDDAVSPSCLAIDDQHLGRDAVDIAIGFFDGSFGVWRLDTAKKHITPRYRHEKSSNGQLVAMAYSNPFLLTATESVLISLYTFDVPSIPPADTEDTDNIERSKEPEAPRNIRYNLERDINIDISPRAPGHEKQDICHDSDQMTLPSPYLLTSLKSHTSRPPLALSIRRATNTTIASIAYTFETRQGSSIGMQDLHIRPPASGSRAAPEITATRLAYTSPVTASPSSHLPITPPRTPFRSYSANPDVVGSPASSSSIPSDAGPTSLCYTHPYLLATLPDNTLILHQCTSNASSLSLSPGIRLWGHTSGISDAEITARGRAVSVSTKGEEMRVWELEGRSSTAQSRSVEIRPDVPVAVAAPEPTSDSEAGLPSVEWEERRNWVGFDDEMVIVLKESEAGGNSLMVYDFT